jgi:hypothetical protein
MTETRIRELFAEAAEDLPVGPAPDLASFVQARRSRRRLAGVSVGLVGAAAASVVVVVSIAGGSPSGGPAKSPSTPVQTSGTFTLDCRNGQRSMSTWEAAGPYRRTPLALGTLFTNPVANEHAVVQSVHGRSAQVILLRGDGTAWAELTLGHDAANRWHLLGSESCPGRYVRMYWQHQDGLFN